MPDPARALPGRSHWRSQPIRLPADGDPAAVRVLFTATEAGPRVFRLKIAPQPGEVVTENNQRDVQIDVRDRRERILYYEGEPRFEMKFMRLAIAEDPNLQLVTLQRTRGGRSQGVRVSRLQMTP